MLVECKPPVPVVNEMQIITGKYYNAKWMKVKDLFTSP